ncbi:hypothetical protein AWL63_13995 [Sphingomonas panacis]|uniref:UrcA family protein n=1 Tax=Sphingomonas panacis TaxID=1560345 RepID=A0A1B3ZBW9_9SPHN|nr:UrcA family protein [Sphingomonas panacis]AOH84905.1 hypothetical protein AWL63_13995 [Sphingomonas panacis]
MKILMISFAAALAALAGPAQAQDRIGPDRYAVVVKAAAHPPTPRAARRALARIEQAALAVCGASSFSLREIRMSVRDSACWRGSVAEAVARADDPLLSAAYHPHR